MNQCLLPIDWLDFLEGRPGAATRAHSDVCVSCRTLVQELQSYVVDAAPPAAEAPDGADRALRAMSLTSSHAPEQVQPAQMWWTASTADLSDRLPVVVLRIFDEARRSWADVAPLWIDEDTATSADLLLAADDNTTGVRWRVAFRHQTVVPRSQLDRFLGVLTPSGAALLEQALAGAIPPGRRGTGLEGEYDPRLADDRWLADAVHTLARPYAALFDEEGDLSQDASSGTGPTQGVPAGGRLLVFRLIDRPKLRQTDYQLAADTGGPGQSVRHAVAVDPATGSSVEGVLAYDFQSDEVRLQVISVSGVDGPVQLVIRSDYLTEPITVQADLISGAVIPLSTGQGISDLDITSLEMHAP